MHNCNFYLISSFRKSTTSFEPQNLNKKFNADSPSKASPAKQGHTSSSRRQRGQIKAGSSRLSAPECCPVETFVPKKKVTVKNNIDNSVLRTEEPYFVSYFEANCSDEIDLRARGDIMKDAASQLEGIDKVAFIT